MDKYYPTCKMNGHTHKECWKKNNKAWTPKETDKSYKPTREGNSYVWDYNTWVNCTTCGRYGHITANYMRKWIQISRNWTNSGMACLHCYKVGYLRKDCRD